MAKFLIRLNCTRTQFDKRAAAIFGERNNGVTIEAENEARALDKFNAPRLPGDKFNPFYLTVKPA